MKEKKQILIREGNAKEAFALLKEWKARCKSSDVLYAYIAVFLETTGSRQYADQGLRFSLVCKTGEVRRTTVHRQKHRGGACHMQGSRCA